MTGLIPTNHTTQDNGHVTPRSVPGTEQRAIISSKASRGNLQDDSLQSTLPSTHPLFVSRDISLFLRSWSPCTMGNSCVKLKKSTAEIAPCEFVKDSPPVVILYGSPAVPLTSYIRFALHHKCVSVRMVSAETPILGPDTLVLQCGSDTVSGSRETLMRYIESRFPRPPLVMSRGGDCDETTPLIVTATRLQHRSMTWHIERMVRWAEDLAARGGRGAVDPTVGSPRMEVKKFGRSYGHLLELMLEHAQMEERIVFPILERADRGNEMLLLPPYCNLENSRKNPKFPVYYYFKIMVIYKLIIYILLYF